LNKRQTDGESRTNDGHSISETLRLMRHCVERRIASERRDIERRRASRRRDIERRLTSARRIRSVRDAVR